MAEPIRLGTELDAGNMLRALIDCPAFDTGTIACLAGNWLDGGALIGWQPRRTIDRLDDLAEGDSERASQPRQRRGAERARSRAGSIAEGRWIGRIGYRGDCWFGLFDTLLRRDRAGRWWLSGDPALAGPIERLPRPEPGELTLTDITATDPDDHLAAVERAILAIRAGELYQVNVCARLSGAIAGDPAELFARGVRRLAPDYAAFLGTPGHTAVSLSPELFLRRRGRSVLSAPIKGTPSARSKPAGRPGRHPAAPLGQGPGGERDDRRPGPQRPVPGVRAGHGDGRRVARRPAGARRLAPGLRGDRPAHRLGRHRRAAGGQLPARLGDRRAQDSGLRADRRTGAGRAWPVHRRHRPGHRAGLRLQRGDKDVRDRR